LAVNPYDLDSLKLASKFAAETGDTAAAVRYNSRIVELEPANGAMWLRLGLDFWKSGDGDQAERALLRARELKADSADSISILGDISAGKKDYAGAARFHGEALKREPERVEWWLKLSDDERAQDRNAEAAQAIE